MTFTCQLTGEPQPEIVWLHNGQPVGTGDRFVVSETVDKQVFSLQLDIADLRTSDAGTVEVVATNEFGRAACDTSLDVEGE